MDHKKLVLVCDDPSAAFEKLRIAERLRCYFPDVCSKPWQRQRVCMERRFEIEGPAFLMTEILRELSPEWRMGKLDD